MVIGDCTVLSSVTLLCGTRRNSLVCSSAEILRSCRSLATRAIIEIKRTVAEPQQLLDQLEPRRKLLARRGAILGVVVSHPNPLFDRECKPDWLSDQHPHPPMTRLLDEDNRPDTDGVMAFIYFLAQVAGYNRLTV